MVKHKKVSIVEELDELVPDRFKSLTETQKEFCKLYVQDWNGTKAYAKLHPKVVYNTAKARAADWINRKRIKDYCDFLNENIEEVTGVSRSWVMEQHLKIVRCSIAHLHDSWIDRVEFDKLTPSQKDCIQEITTQTRTEKAEGEEGEHDVQVDYVKIKLYDKQKALDAITRMMGYDKAQKVELSGKLEGITPITNVQVNIYNTAPPLADSEKNIRE